MVILNTFVFVISRQDQLLSGNAAEELEVLLRQQRGREASLHDPSKVGTSDGLQKSVLLLFTGIKTTEQSK